MARWLTRSQTMFVLSLAAIPFVLTAILGIFRGDLLANAFQPPAVSYVVGAAAVVVGAALLHAGAFVLVNLALPLQRTDRRALRVALMTVVSLAVGLFVTLPACFLILFAPVFMEGRHTLPPPGPASGQVSPARLRGRSTALQHAGYLKPLSLG